MQPRGLSDLGRTSTAASPKIVIDLGRLGVLGRIVGFFACLFVGIVFGASGSLVAGLLPFFALAGIFGQEQPSALGLTLTGAWVAALFGVIPGGLIGAYLGASRHETRFAIFAILALLAGCAAEWAVGYPTTVPAFCLYYLAPFLSLFISIPLVRTLKVRLGLYPKEVAAEIEKQIDEHFTSLGV